MAKLQHTQGLEVAATQGTLNQRAAKGASRLKGIASAYIAITILASSVVVATASISEITSRQHAIAEISSLESDATRASLHSGVITQAKAPTLKPIPTAPEPERTLAEPLDRTNAAPPSSMWMYATDQRRLQKIDLTPTEQIKFIQLHAGLARSEINALITRGSNLNGSARMVLQRLRQVAISIHPDLDGIGSDATSRLFEFMQATFAPFELDIPLISYIRNDFLIAITIIACTIVGSGISIIRANQQTVLSLQQLVLGLASGFVTFLALRGGRSIFMLDTAGEAPNFNPYSMAFSGLLVGLFTQRAYALMTLLVDELESRLRVAVAGTPIPTRTQGSDPPRDATASSTQISATAEASLLRSTGVTVTHLEHSPPKTDASSSVQVRPE